MSDWARERAAFICFYYRDCLHMDYDGWAQIEIGIATALRAERALAAEAVRAERERLAEVLRPIGAAFLLRVPKHEVAPDSFATDVRLTMGEGRAILAFLAAALEADHTRTEGE